MKDPKTMSGAELARCVSELQQVMWPGGNPLAEWDSGTWLDLCDVFSKYELTPFTDWSPKVK